MIACKTRVFDLIEVIWFKRTEKDLTSLSIATQSGIVQVPLTIESSGIQAITNLKKSIGKFYH